MTFKELGHQKFFTDRLLYLQKTLRKPITEIYFWPYSENYAVTGYVSLEPLYKEKAYYMHKFAFHFMGIQKELFIRKYGENSYSLSVSDPANYPGGRYVNCRVVKEDGEATIDFNFMSNLMCAYENYWDCELPDNKTDWFILAGEKEQNKKQIL